MDVYLALVPNKARDKGVLHAAMSTLVDFHQRHEFKGHIIVVGDYGVTEDVKLDLQRGLEGSTLVWAPTSGE